MRTTVVDERWSQASGIPFRRLQVGPEQELVNWFLQELPFSPPAGCRTTVFREPRLESGFPDVVVVIWRPETTLRWADQRRELTTRDIRVLHHLALRGPSTLEELSEPFAGGLVRCLERLESAATIRRIGKRYSARSLSRTFAVQRIIAFEAKVRGWNGVLAQASLNTWFASHSFVLIPDSPRVEDFAQAALLRGVGVWTQDHGCVSQPAEDIGRLPLSYASWLFNEWVWRIHRLDSDSDSCLSTSIGYEQNSLCCKT